MEEKLYSSNENDSSTTLNDEDNYYNDDTDGLSTLDDDWDTSATGDDTIDVLSLALEQVTVQIHEIKNEIQTKLSSEWTSITKNRLQKQKLHLEAQRAVIQERLLRQYTQINNRIHRDAKTMRLRDKVSFVLGVGNTWITPVIAARIPIYIPIYYTVQSFYLITIRYFIYRSKRWHYFFFDLCYYVNLLTLLFLWAFPSSTLLYTAAFTLTNGPVIWAIITWRNSLVFHSLDKVTSVFIHIFPALVTYTLRWLPVLHRDPEIALAYRNLHFPGASQMPSTMGWWYTLIVSTLFYLAWQIFYIAVVVIARGDKVEKGSYTTSYSTLLNDSSDSNKKKGKKPFILRLACMFGERYKLPMLIFWQFWYTLGTCALTYFYYKSFWLHSFCLVTMFGVSVWNGASYYIDVFSKRYLTEVENQLAAFKEKNLQPLNQVNMSVGQQMNNTMKKIQ
ncbi:uncharacterized protein BX663DRAFT_502326 [Cokeromyces recurvatus]|uniref:uncharacterized protein n=1 Tax=Cokeromyces recurvatus TaxID=90255 RepID=UPI00222061AB|nr:uncharacterized protein BX663DRAFT_502326 [Cokeromyces recurvatus]KAI7905278.1 hypothetical protein BX663DRAFT_502326 [Cokeromyces recurvatus]